MLFLQLILYCLIFTLMVRLSALGGRVNALYFYPIPIQERVVDMGLTDFDTVKRKKLCFAPILYLVLLVSLVLIIGFWNGVSDFKTAYLQSLLFLLVMNWYDGIVVDRLWVGHTSFWVIPGNEDLRYMQTWVEIFKKRITVSLIMLIVSAITAWIIISI